MSEPSVEVEVRDASGRATRVPIANRRAVIGRSEGCEVQIDAPVVSRRHAELSLDPFGRWWVRDLGSRNGTLVNGKVVRESVVTHADSIGIESYILRLCNDHHTPAAAMAPAVDDDTMEVTLSDDMAGPVRRLADLPAPTVQAAHLTALTQFGRALLTVAAADERRKRLCELMVSDVMRGRTAMVLRVARDPQRGKAAPKLLVGPVYANQVYDRTDPYVSRTLLAAARESEAAVIASNTGSGASDIELSIAADVMQLAAVACPLRIDDASMELLYVTFPSTFGTPEWLALAKLAGDQFEQAESAWAARHMAEEQAVIENELQRARRIQMNLVPREVSIPGLDVALGFEPCKWVGGDYADVVPFGDGRVFIIVADVCGKGMQAALITACLHTLVHTHVRPGAAMTQVIGLFNDYLEATLPADSFVTAVAAAIDPATGRIEMVNCGHPPAMVVLSGSRASDVRRLQVAANPPLGCMAPLDFESQIDELPPGDVLAMYTDGLSELVDATNAMLGVDGVEAMLRDVASQTTTGEVAVRHWADALRTRLSNFLGDAQPQDDQCFTLFRRV